MCHGLARVLHDDLRDIGGIGEVKHAFHDDELRPPVYGVLRERMPIDLEAHDAEEHVARHHGIAAIRQAAYLIGRVPDNGALQTFEQL